MGGFEGFGRLAEFVGTQPDKSGSKDPRASEGRVGRHSDPPGDLFRDGGSGSPNLWEGTFAVRSCHTDPTPTHCSLAGNLCPCLVLGTPPPAPGAPAISAGLGRLTWVSKDTPNRPVSRTRCPQGALPLPGCHGWPWAGCLWACVLVCLWYRVPLAAPAGQTPKLGIGGVSGINAECRQPTPWCDAGGGVHTPLFGLCHSKRISEGAPPASFTPSPTPPRARLGG